MTSQPGDTLAGLIRQHRDRMGLTQEELAERAGISARSVSDLERGLSRRPYRHTIEQLSTALQLTRPERDELIAAARSGRRTAHQRAQPSLPDTGIAAPDRRRDGYPLVGREREQEAIREFLLRDDTPVLLIAGEPGIGKSRLLQDLATQAELVGYAVLQGGCHRRSSAEAYSPIADIIGDALLARDVSERQRLLEGCAWIARVVPEIVDAMVDPPGTSNLTPGHERRLVFAATLRLLHRLAGPSGTLLILDDLQWVGADACDLLQSIVGTGDAGHVRLRIVGAYRTTEISASGPTGVLLADLATQDLARHLELGPLAPNDSAEILQHILEANEITVPDTTRDRIVARSGGVPFTLVSFAHGVRSDRAQANDPAFVPWNVAQSVRHRIAMLPSDAIELLTLAAVTGRRCAVETVFAALGLPEPSARAALTSASHAGLIQAVAAGEVQFTHDVIRDTIEAGIGVGLTPVLHRRVAEAIEQTTTSASDRTIETLAEHYAIGDPHNHTGKFLTYALEVAERSMARHAWAAAIPWFARAISLLDQQAAPDPRQLCETLLGYAYAMAWTGAVGRSGVPVEVVRRASEAARLADSPELFARVAIAFDAVAGVASPTRAEAGQMLQEALEWLTAVDPRNEQLRSRLMVVLANNLWRRSTNEQERAHAADLVERALPGIRRFGDPNALIHALVIRLQSGWTPDNPHERLACAREIVEIQQRFNDQIEPEHEPEGYWEWLVTALELNDPGEIAASIDAFRSRHDDTLLPAGRWNRLCTLALIAIVRGEIAEATTLVNTAMRVYGTMDEPSLEQAIPLYRELCQLPELAEQVRTMESLVPPDFGDRYLGYVHLLLLLYWLETGEVDRVRRIWATVGDPFARLLRDEYWLAKVALIGELAVALEDVPIATQCYDALASYAHCNVVAGSSFVFLGSVSYYLGLLAELLGQIDDAGGHFSDAIEMNERIDATVFAARARYAWARMLLRHDDARSPSRADNLLRSACASARQHGMTKLLRDITAIASMHGKLLR